MGRHSRCIRGRPARDRAHRRWAPCRALGTHGFTVHRRPAQLGEASVLSFDLAVRGTLRPRVLPGARGVGFDDANGHAVLTYSGLLAFDADGVVLDARIEADASGLWILVQEASARYPITVDPTVQVAYLKASNPGTPDWFGGSVAISGDLAVVGRQPRVRGPRRLHLRAEGRYVGTAGVLESLEHGAFGPVRALARALGRHAGDRRDLRGQRRDQRQWRPAEQQHSELRRRSIRLRPPRGLVATTSAGRFDLSSVASVLGEVSIPERALKAGLASEGPHPRGAPRREPGCVLRPACARRVAVRARRRLGYGDRGAPLGVPRACAADALRRSGPERPAHRAAPTRAAARPCVVRAGVLG